jgi:predicted acylesterase/phospholipase RssA
MDILQKRKIGLVLSGGGIKAAAFHIGVCLALRDLGFKFAGGSMDMTRHTHPDKEPLSIRLYVGSSAGAFIAAVLSAGYGIESLVNAFQIGSGRKPLFDPKDLTSMKPIGYRHIFAVNGNSLLNYLPDSLLSKSLFTGGIEALIKKGFKLNGFFSTRGMERYLRKYVLVENEFSRLGVELYIVATQLNHSRKAIFGPFTESTKTKSTKFINYASISEAVAASIALPPVFSPYPIKNEASKTIYYYDGEIRETLSSHIAADHGCDLVISSYSVQPYHFNHEIGSLHQFGIPVILNQALYQVIQQKISKHIEWESNLNQIYLDIEKYCRKNHLKAEHKDKLLEIVKNRTRFKPEVDYIYIHPRPQNYQMFFVDHFSLNPETLEQIVKIGFKSTVHKFHALGYSMR